MRNIDLPRIRVSILCYGISALIFLCIYLFGIYLKPGDEMGYCLLFLYIIMPLTSFTASFIVSIKRGYLFYLYPALFGFLGLIIPYIIFRSFDLTALFFAFVPALIGLVPGLIKLKK